jgi:hypothetical protein
MTSSNADLEKDVCGQFLGIRANSLHHNSEFFFSI